jgi:hypothetical protein
MRLNFLSFVLCDFIAKNRGVPNAIATRDGLVGALIGPPILGVVLTSALAQNQASSLPVTSPSRAVGGSGVAASGLRPGLGPAKAIKNLTAMPSFLGMPREQAETFARLLDLKVETEGNGIVISQEPDIGKRPNPNGTLKLKTNS